LDEPVAGFIFEDEESDAAFFDGFSEETCDFEDWYALSGDDG
jgi:hypothetical protein